VNSRVDQGSDRLPPREGTITEVGGRRDHTAEKRPNSQACRESEGSRHGYMKHHDGLREGNVKALSEENHPEQDPRHDQSARLIPQTIKLEEADPERQDRKDN
jgi:hypothetical protein